MPFKGRAKLLTSEEVKHAPEYAGVLKDGIAVIDVDNAQQADILQRIIEAEGIECPIMKTTRGKHFIFRDDAGLYTKCKTHTQTAVGITVDVKVGRSTSIEVLKHGGEVRPIIKDADKLPQLPKWLVAIRSTVDFINMSEGDGRNQALFNHILPCQAAGLTVDEIRHAINLINAYVLDEPLAQEEIDTITRDEAFAMLDNETFWHDGKFQHWAFADWMIREHHIKRINGQLHVYKGGVYVPAKKYLGGMILDRDKSLKKSQRKEVVDYIDEWITDDTRQSDARYIAFRNGIYDLETDSLLPFTPSIVITNQIPHDYNPEAYSSVLDGMLDKLTVGDGQVRALVEEMVGYCFYRKNVFRAGAFFLTGSGSNGKSTFIDMLRNLLGDDNVSTLDVKDFSKQFRIVLLFGMLANLADDISNKYIEDSAEFKKLVTGEAITMEYKGKDGFTSISYATQIFTVNEMPRMNDAGGATTDRMIQIPFDAKFSADDADYDPHIKTKLMAEDCQEHLILLGIQGIKRALAHGRFTMPDKVARATAEYKRENDPIIEFFETVGIDEVVNHSVANLYLRYSTFCSEGNFTPLTKTRFSKRIKDRYGVDVKVGKVQGKSTRIFYKT